MLILEIPSWKEVAWAAVSRYGQVVCSLIYPNRLEKPLRVWKTSLKPHSARLEIGVEPSIFFN